MQMYGNITVSPTLNSNIPCCTRTKTNGSNRYLSLIHI